MTTATRARRLTAWTVAAALTLSGCQTTNWGDLQQSAAPLTPAEQQLRDEANAFNETVAGGVVTGAVIGALLGALLAANSGKRSNIAQGALVGAAAGGILGGVDGYITAKARENANSQVRMLNAMAEDVRKDNEKLARLIASANSVLDDSKKRLGEIKAEVEAKKITLAQAEEERARIEQNGRLMSSAADTARRKQEQYRDARNKMAAQGGSTAGMDAEIARLEGQIRALEANVDALNSSLEVTRVG